MLRYGLAIGRLKLWCNLLLKSTREAQILAAVLAPIPWVFNNGFSALENPASEHKCMPKEQPTQLCYICTCVDVYMCKVIYIFLCSTSLPFFFFSKDIKMDPAAPATRMTSSFTINISTPSFYNQPKKFAPVVPPKPKVNPFKAAEEGDPKNNFAGPQDNATAPGIRAFLGKVGEFPSLAPPGGEQEGN